MELNRGLIQRRFEDIRRSLERLERIKGLSKEEKASEDGSFSQHVGPHVLAGGLQKGIRDPSGTSWRPARICAGGWGVTLGWACLRGAQRMSFLFRAPWVSRGRG